MFILIYINRKEAFKMNKNVINHCISEINRYFNRYRDTTTAVHYSRAYIYDCFSYGIIKDSEYKYLDSYIETQADYIWQGNCFRVKKGK